MEQNTLITNYKHFNYSSEFVPNYNVFNINSSNYIGIGTYKPKYELDIHDSFSVKGNLIISGNMIFNKNTTYNDVNAIHVLYKNSTDDAIKIGKLTYYSPDYKYDQFNWYKKNGELYINTHDNRPNTILEYRSSFYSITNSTSYNIDLIVSSKILIKYLYVLDTSYNVVPNLTGMKINNITLTYDNNIYKLETPIILYPNIKTRLSVSSIPNTPNKIIQFIGTHDYSAGSFWFNNSAGININRNISVFSNNTFHNTLYVNGNVNINNNLNTEDIIGNNINIHNNIVLNNTLNVNKIQSINDLLLQTSNISFGKYKNNNLCSIGDYSYITNSGDLHIKDLTIKKNINNVNQIYHHQNKSFIRFDNNINIGYNFLSSIYEKPVFQIGDKETNIYCNTIIANKTISNGANKLFILGNVNIKGTLDINKKISYPPFDIKQDYTYEKMTFNDLNVDGLCSLGTYTETNKIVTDTLDASYINFKIDSITPNLEFKNTGKLWFNSNTNRFYSYVTLSNNETQLFTFADKPFNDTYTLYNNNSIMKLHKSVNTDTINVTKLNSLYLNTDNSYISTLKLPLHSTTPNGIILHPNTGTILFNKTSLNYELHDSTKWRTIIFDKFNNKSQKYKIEIKQNPRLIKEQFIPIIPQNFYYTINSSSIISGNSYILTYQNANDMANSSENRYLINNNLITIGTDTFAVHNVSDNGENYTATLTNINSYDDIYTHITEVSAGTYVTNGTNLNNNTNLKNYINANFAAGKVYTIYSNKIFADGYIDTNIRITKKKQISDDTFDAYLVYDNASSY